MAALTKEKIIILSIISQSGSKISINFDIQISNLDLFLLGMVTHFLIKNIY